jgi:hypothetical protein
MPLIMLADWAVTEYVKVVEPRAVRLTLFYEYYRQKDSDCSFFTLKSFLQCGFVGSSY